MPAGAREEWVPSHSGHIRTGGRAYPPAEMTEYTTDPAHDHPEEDTRAHVRANGGAPTETLVAGAVGDRCVACGAPLSSDQRYCVVCGERRGASRFALPVASAQEETTRIQSTRTSRTGRRNPLGLGAGATLIAGVGTLLLAMLVGVLIGHNTAGTAKTVAGPVRVIKINEGASAPAASTSASASSGSGSSTHTKSKKSSNAKKHNAPSKAVAKKQSDAAAKVTGGSGGVPSTVTVGATGTGKGYSKKTHKFNGSFFGQ
jgi:hypothetical protein